MMKKLTSLLLSAALMISLLACGASAAKTKSGVRIAGLKGPTTMGLVNLLDMERSGKASQHYDLQLYGAADEIVPKLIKGELDMAAIPANLAATLYQKTNGGIQVMAVNTLGVLYVVEKGGETVTDVASLSGKTIYATGKGATPEYALTYLLSQHGLTLGTDVQVEWKSEPTEVVAQMAQEEGAAAMLPQPFVTVAQGQVEGLRVALDLSAQWDGLDNGSRLVTAGLLVRKAFADEHPQAVAKFLEEYAASVDYVNENPTEAAVLVEQQGIVKAAVAEKAIPYCSLVCITGEDMKTAVSGYLQTLYDLKPETVGGAMPDDGFYWMGA